MGGGQDSSAPTLDEECEDVTEDETLRQPGHADDRVRFCVRSAYDSAESHVDRCGEEGWRDEDEEGLNDVGRERFGMTVTDSTANVPMNSTLRGHSVSRVLCCILKEREPVSRQQGKSVHMPPTVKGKQNHNLVLIKR